MQTSDDLIEKILSSGPSPSTFLLILSRMKEEGNLESFVRESQRALEIYPHDLPIRQLLAEYYLETGQVSQAEAELEKVIGQIDDLISSYKLRAEIFIRQGMDEDAVGPLRIYLAHRPDDQEALSLLETLLPPEESLAEPATAMEKMPQAVEEEMEESTISEGKEGLPEILTPTLAEIYFEQGQISEAIETYEKIIAQNPDDASKQRLDDLKALVLEEKAAEDKRIRVARVRQRKERMISILEEWLTNIREKTKAPLSIA